MLGFTSVPTKLTAPGASQKMTNVRSSHFNMAPLARMNAAKQPDMGSSSSSVKPVVAASLGSKTVNPLKFDMTKSDITYTAPLQMSTN
jgi:hypothetical protein